MKTPAKAKEQRRKERPGNSCRISVFPGGDGKDQNDSREGLIRTSHTAEDRSTLEDLSLQLLLNVRRW